MALKRKRITSYMKNVARSFGYMLGDAFSEYNPVIKTIAKESKETTESIYNSIKEINFNGGSIDEKGLKGQITSSINDVWNNLKEDISTGNWYNKERMDAADSQLAKAMGLDFDMDFDFDMDDWGDEDDESSSDDFSMDNDDRNTAATINAMDIVGSNVANSISSATAESADYIVKSNNQATRALYDLNQRGFGAVASSMSAINDSIISFAQVVKPLSEHMQNAATFYLNTTQTLNDINQSIKEIVKNTTPTALAGDKEVSTKKGTFGSLFDSDTGISIESYKELIKENFSDYKDIVDMGLNAVKNLKSEDGSYGKNISLAKMATSFIGNALIPKMFKDAMVQFNDSIKYTMASGVLKLKNYSPNNLVLGILKDFLVPNDGFKNTINVGNYNKEQVPWDGVARKALIEVIPTTLLKIYSAITGEPEYRYNYDTGKFVKMSSIQKEVDERRFRYAKSAGGDFRDDAINKIKENERLNEEQKKKLTSEIDSYFLKAFTKGEGFTEINKNSFNPEQFGLTADSLKILKDLLEEYRSSTDRNKRNRHNEFMVNVQRERDSYGDFLRRQEANGIDTEIYLNNGFAEAEQRAGGIGTKQFISSISDYVKGIFENSESIVSILSEGSGRRRGRRPRGSRRNSVNAIRQEIQSQEQITNEPIAGERTLEDANHSNDEIGEILDEDEAAAKEKEERLKNVREEFDKRTKSIKERLLGLFKKDDPNNLYALYSRPFNAVSKFLNKIGNSLDKLIWGEGDDIEGGIFGYIFTKTKEALNKFKEWADDKFGIKDKFNKLKDKLLGKKNEEGKREGGQLSDFINETGDNLKEFGNGFKNSVTNPLKDFFGDEQRVWKKKQNDSEGEIDKAAHGRKVTKSGIVAVSQGELIIPSELNPFYHGATNKASQEQNEDNIVDNFYGKFTKGGTAGVDGEFQRRGAKRQEKKVRGAKEKGPTQKETLKRLRAKFENNDDYEYEVVKEEGAGHKFIREGFEKVTEGVTATFNKITGDGTEETAKKDAKIVKEVISKATKEAGDKKGAMGAGALIGAGASLLTGAVIGPFAGAAVGAAVGLVAKSETVQKILFGDVDEKGDRKGGILSKKISNFITKHAPSIGKGAGIGTVAGAVFGSPILGAVIGGTVGFVKSSTDASEFIFGKKDENGDRHGGIIPGEFQKKIKKAAPSIAVGVLATVATGPFGLAGNMILGGTLGYLAHVHKFNEYLFGKKDDKNDKGLVGLIKERILDNLENIFANMGNALAGWGKKLIRETGENIKDFFSKKARAYENGEGGILTRLVGGSISLAGKAVKGTVNTTGNILDKVNSHLEAKNLSKGYGVYDREKKRNMYASERVKARGENDNSTFGNFDRVLANAKSKEELEELRSNLEDARDPSRIFKRSKNKALNSLYAALADLDPKKATKVAKLVEKGDLNSLDKIRSILSPQEFEKYKDPINEALNAMSKAKDTKSSQKAILNKLKESGIDFKNGDIGTALDNINHELNDKRFSEEAQEKEETKTFRERVTDALDSIVGVLDPKKKKKKEDNKSENKEETTDTLTQNNEEEPKGITDLLEGLNKSKEESEEESKRTVFDAMGNPIQQIRNSQGEWIPDNSDKETKANREKMSKVMDGLTSLPLIGGAISGMNSLFDKLSGSLFGNKEEKKGLLGTLMDFMKDGPLNKITNFLTGNPIGAKISSIAKNVSLGTIIGGIVAPMLLAGGFTGKFDGLGKTLGDKIDALKGNDTKSPLDNNETDTINGKEIAKDEFGRYIRDENGDFQMTDGTTESGLIKTYGENTSISANLKRNLVTRTIMSGGKELGVTSKVISGAKKSWGKMLGKTAEAATENTGLINGILSTISKALEKLPKILTKIPFLPAAIKNNADEIATTLYTYIDDAVRAAGSKLGNIAAKLSAVMPYVQIALIVGKGINAWGNAESILGITEKATFGQRVIATLIAVANASIPFIGDLIPNKVLVNIFVDLATKFGIDIGDLQEQRERANEEVTKYNEENGTNLDIEAYNQMNGRAGIFTKAKNGVKSAFKNIKEQGFGKTAKNVYKAVQEKTISAAKSVNEYTGFTEILKMMKDGDVKGVLSYSPATEEDGTGMSILKAIPSIPIKYCTIVPTMFVALGKKIAGFFSGIVNKVKSIFNIATEEQQYGEKLMYQEDSKFSDYFKMKEPDPENPMGGFEKIFRMTFRLSGIPMAMIKKLGSKIKNWFSGIANTVKNGYSTYETNGLNISNLTDKGDIMGLLNYEIQRNEDNPLDGIFGALGSISKYTNIPIALFHATGNVIKGIFNKISNVIKNGYSTYEDNCLNISNLTDSGDIKGLLAYEIQRNEDNPLDGIFSALGSISKYTNIPMALFHATGKTIKAAFNKMMEFTKSNKESLSKSISTLKEMASEGNVGGILKAKVPLNDLDPLHGIWSAAFGINKLFQAAIGIFKLITKPIGDAIKSVKKWFTKKAEDIYDSAKNYVSDDDSKKKKKKKKKKSKSGGDSGIDSKDEFVSQYDYRYKDKKLGNSTVAEKGCGPAVATMLSNKYGAGLSMDDALKSASKYQDKDGTKIEYFKDVLGKKGIGVNELSGNNLQEDIINNLSNGNSVILLGNDPKNKSKKNSPFGPNNHYVVASGIDKNGNIIIEDPESSGPKSYSMDILKNAKAGLRAESGGDSSGYDTETAQKVWGFFTSKGYSPAATAGIMGNLYQESGMNPARFQDGGPAAGIAQWERYNDAGTRWGNLNKFAQSIGYQWSDLDPQLQFIDKEINEGRDVFFKNDEAMAKAGTVSTTKEAFMNATDPMLATRQFEGAFERAGTPAMENRLKAAEAYYQLYQDSNYTGNYTADPSSGVVAGDTSSSGSSNSGNSSSTSIGGIISTIVSAFTTGLGKVFGESSDQNSSSSGSTGGSDSSGTSGSYTAVDGAVGDGTDKQKQLAQALIDKQGQLDYNKNGPRDPDKGSADCSSTIDWAYKKITNTDVGNNTAAMLSNDKTEIIDLASGISESSGGSNGSGPNVSKLMPGDILLYSRPEYGFSQGRPYRVGHAEMYIGNNQRIGHPGPGKGPRIASIDKDAGRYIMAKRLKGITDGYNSSGTSSGPVGSSQYIPGTNILKPGVSAAGSGLLSYDDYTNMSGGSSGILLNARPSARLYGDKNQQIKAMSSRLLNRKNKLSGGNSDLVQETTSMLNNIKGQINNAKSSGSISSELVERLLNSIIKILETISNNTNSVQQIYDLLVAYTGTSASNSTPTNNTTNITNNSTTVNNSNQSNVKEVDSYISDLVGTLGAIARG